MRRSESRPYVDRWLGLSLAGHLALGLVLLSVKFSGSTPSFLVAAGPGGEGGGSGSAIEVGLVQDWELAKFFPASPTGALTEEPHLSTARIEQVQRPDDQPELLLPGHEQRRPDPRQSSPSAPSFRGPAPIPDGRRSEALRIRVLWSGRRSPSPHQAALASGKALDSEAQVSRVAPTTGAACNRPSVHIIASRPLRDSANDSSLFGSESPETEGSFQS